MLTKPFGRTGVVVPAIALGTTGFGTRSNHDPGRVRQKETTLRWAIDAGLTFLDTAELYGGGFSEERVAHVISGVRQKVFLATKFNTRDTGADSVVASLDASLRRLRTDYVDLYQWHWPNPFVSIERTMAALEKAVESGKVRFVGVSNFSLRGLRDVQASFNGRISSIQVEYNLADRSPEAALLPYCAAQGITVLAYSPLNQGRVLGCRAHAAVVERIAKDTGQTVVQVVLRWLASRTAVVPVTRTSRLAHAQEAAGALGFDLSPSHRAVLDAMPGPEVVQVPTGHIRLRAGDSAGYASVDQARANALDLIPSPMALAMTYAAGDPPRPIRLVPAVDDPASYEFSTHDYMDQVKKYWAWVIAFGVERPIPALVDEAAATGRP